MPKIASAKVLEVTGFTSENVRFCYKGIRAVSVPIGLYAGSEDI